MTDQAFPPQGDGTQPPPPPPPPGSGTPPPPPPPPPPPGSGTPPPAGGTAQPVPPPSVAGTPPPPPAAPDFKPVRPGEDIPQGGIEPTQVFATPPPPPPQAQGGAQPPQDQGPPPPPPGQQYTDEQLKQMGYDDEDIRVLREVGDYRFASISDYLNNEQVSVPVHPETNFDEHIFLSWLRGSISLTRDEKWRIIQAIPKLSQFQIDELQKILSEERRKFSELSPKHLLQLMKLEQKHADDWKDLQNVTLQQGAKQEDSQEVDEIRKQLGI